MASSDTKKFSRRKGQLGETIRVLLWAAAPGDHYPQFPGGAFQHSIRFHETDPVDRGLSVRL